MEEKEKVEPAIKTPEVKTYETKKEDTITQTVVKFLKIDPNHWHLEEKDKRNKREVQIIAMITILSVANIVSTLTGTRTSLFLNIPALAFSGSLLWSYFKHNFNTKISKGKQ